VIFLFLNKTTQYQQILYKRQSACGAYTVFGTSFTVTAELFTVAFHRRMVDKLLVAIIEKGRAHRKTFSSCLLCTEMVFKLRSMNIIMDLHI